MPHARNISLALISIVAVMAFLPGCHPKTKAKPVQIRIFRDLNSPYAHELDHRILEFQQTNPRLGDGASILVETVPGDNYQSSLQNHLGRDLTTDVVILNSPQDAATIPALQAELAHAANICAAVRACPAEVPAFVPAKLAGTAAEASNKFLAFLQKP